MAYLSSGLNGREHVIIGFDYCLQATIIADKSHTHRPAAPFSTSVNADFVRLVVGLTSCEDDRN